jgi:hypothetical protein
MTSTPAAVLIATLRKREREQRESREKTFVTKQTTNKQTGTLDIE